VTDAENDAPDDAAPTIPEAAPDEGRDDAPDTADIRDTPEQPAPSTPAGFGRGRRILTVLAVLVLSLFCAWAANVFLNYSTWRGVAGMNRHLVLHPAGQWPSLLAVWVVVVLVFALIGRLWLSMGLLAVLTVFLGAVNIAKIEQRHEPLYPGDTSYLNQPSFIASFVPKKDLIGGVVGIVVAIALAWFVGWLIAKVFPPLWRSLTRKQLWALRGVRLLVVVLCALLLHSAANFNEAGNHWRKVFDATGLRWRPWDSVANYQKNGFVSGLLFNMHVNAMAKPAGYNKAAIEAIEAKYTKLAAQMNKGRKGTLDGVNVVDILSESLSQPEWLNTVKLAADPLPNLTSMMSKTVSGKLLTWGYGGGTANMEFEELTGQSMAQFSPQLESPYEQLIPKYKTYPSIVGWLKKRGHTPIAIHPFSTKMYKRVQVFQRFGFDQFIDKDTIKDKRRAEPGARYIGDQAAFNQVLDEIDSHTSPVYIHLITMQNHTPYQNQYSDPIIPLGGEPKSLDKYYGQYLRGINLTDTAFKKFTDALKAEPDKPTVVIFYGDHLPPQVYPANLVSKEGVRVSHQTPYLIWSNVKKLKHTALPTISPTHFMPMLFDALDVPIPPYYALLDAVQKQVPAMDAGIKIGADDQIIKPKGLDAAQTQVLEDYKLIQYDLSVGHRWSESTMFGNAPK
jgi:phosphoglycerol transferase MdoB-like AlkP superfamily enzyme